MQLGNERHHHRAHAGQKRGGARALHEDIPRHCSQPRRAGGRVLHPTPNISTAFLYRFDPHVRYSLGAIANLCCCREAVQLFYELDGPRHVRQVVLPSRHQLAHPFALILSAVTGEQFDGALGSPKATLDAVNCIVDAGLLAPLLVFASLPASGEQAQQVLHPSLSHTASCLCHRFPAPLSRDDSAVRVSSSAHENHAARPPRLYGGGYGDAACCAGAIMSPAAPPPPAAAHAAHAAFAPQAVTAWANQEAETEDS